MSPCFVAARTLRELSSVFDRYWNSSHAWPVESVVRSDVDEATARRRFDELVQNAPPDFETTTTSDALGRVSVDAELTQGRVSLTSANAAVFADSPTRVELRNRDESLATVARSTLEAVKAAREEVLIASPYFIPGPLGMAMMREAREQEIYELSPDQARAAGRFGNFGKSFGRLHAKLVVIDRRQLFVGSMNLDARSAWSNTESGLLIDSPELATNILGLISNDRNESVYRLRLAADKETIEWVATDPAGKERILVDEPDNSWLLRLKMFLIGPFTSEDLL